MDRISLSVSICPFEIIIDLYADGSPFDKVGYFKPTIKTRFHFIWSQKVSSTKGEQHEGNGTFYNLLFIFQPNKYFIKIFWKYPKMHRQLQFNALMRDNYFSKLRLEGSLSIFEQTLQSLWVVGMLSLTISKEILLNQIWPWPTNKLP